MTYEFEVPAWFRYTITADSEEKARDILIKEGGLSIDGELCGLDYKSYQTATLVLVDGEDVV